ncbi:MAG: ATP-dependent zinc metalloprotease FtsH [Chitinivibrionales bacterium]|nr:ATP-dependent zinc metalloprotease FtsH [Chitinivibrionales bacterium]
MNSENAPRKSKNLKKKIPQLKMPSGLGNKPSKKPARREFSRTLVVWLVLALGVVLALRTIGDYSTLRETKLTYSQFKQLMANPQGRILRAIIIQKPLGRAILQGEVANPSVFGEIQGAKIAPGTKSFSVNLPFVDSAMLAEWDKAGFQYYFETEKMNWGDILINLLPWLLMIVFWVFMIRQMQAGQRGIFSFGKSRIKTNNLDRPQNTFNDAAGVEEAKAELQEIIEFLKDPKKFKRLGGKIPKGVLLLGPPGTGKTLLARCVAGEAGVPFLSMSGSDFVEMFVGVGASRVRDLFDTAKRNSPCIIFIDEIDAVGRQRGAGLGGGHDEREQTLNQMLVEMDGFEVNSGVILIAATNRPDVLDPALLRPGRFDRQVVVDLPDIRGREGILKVHTKSIPLGPDVNLHTIAAGTPGFVGADLANLVNEAALMAARFSQETVTMLDFEEAKDKVMMGVERKSLVLSDAEKRNTAYHEAGHAICNLNCKESDPLHKVTIIPRGRALGVTFSLPGEDKHSYTKGYLLDRICISMGGRCAEEMIFGLRTTGAANDIKQATELVRKLICDYGMTEELGPLSYGEKDEQIFLGRDFNRGRNYSDKTAEQIDGLMRNIIDDQYRRALAILKDHRTELERLATALLEHEMLDAEEIQKIIHGEFLDKAKKTRSLFKRPEAPGNTDANPPAGTPESPEKTAEPKAAEAGKNVDVTIDDTPGAVTPPEGLSSEKPDDKKL